MVFVNRSPCFTAINCFDYNTWTIHRHCHSGVGIKSLYVTEVALFIARRMKPFPLPSIAYRPANSTFASAYPNHCIAGGTHSPKGNTALATVNFFDGNRLCHTNCSCAACNDSQKKCRYFH